MVRSALIRHENKRLLVVQASPNATADLVDVLLRDLTWAKIQRIRVVPELPLDKRHNAKIDYPALRQLLSGSAT